MGTKQGRQTAIALAAAAVLTAGGVWFGVHFYNSAPRTLTPAQVVRRDPELPEVTAEAVTAGTQDTISEKDSSSESSQAESSHHEEETSSTDESSQTESLPADSSQADESLPPPQDEVRLTDSTADDAAQPAAVQAMPDAAAPTQTVGSGAEADKEYFTTSIEDGGTVSDSTYFFTITQQTELELIRCDVELNGSVLTGYAGKCRLKEGSNTIRVSCTYKDGDGRIMRAFRDYTVTLKSPDSAIYTDLTDRDVFSPELTFTAESESGISVWLNGQPVSGSGSFTVTLNEGENMIRLSSGRQTMDFSVTYIPLSKLDIITDLDDCTVYTSELTFTAQAAGGSAPKLTVQVNGTTVKGEENRYTAALYEGANTVRLLARDGTDRCEKYFTVTCLPELDETALPYLTDVSLTDNMTVKGSSYSLSFKAFDCDGNRLYSDSMEVACGGAAAERRWEDASSTGYLLKLHQGENSVYIKLTDSIGRQSEFFYNINCESAEEGEEVGRISIKAQADVLGLGVLCENDSYPILEGETGFDTVVRFLEENGFEVSSRGSDSSRYLARIFMPGRFAGGALTDDALAYLENAGISVNNSGDPDSLGEFDYTPASGWLYCRGGKKPSYAMSAAVFSDGEDIELRFSLDFGNDVGSE